jgi:hypothetical protein
VVKFLYDVRSIASPLLLQSSAFQIPLDGCREYSVDFNSRFFEFKICRYFNLHFQSIDFKIEIQNFDVPISSRNSNMQEQNFLATTWKSWLGNILAPSTYSSTQGLLIFLNREIILRLA